jgi:hypothetical protein
VKGWWRGAIHKWRQSRKALASIAMLVSWKVSKEKNKWVFMNKSKIKEEAKMWSLVGAKAITNIMP